jgi:hypothetical protein
MATSYYAYDTAAKEALKHIRSRVRYRGLNTLGGWIRNPFEGTEKFVARLTNKVMGAVADKEYGNKKFNPDYYIEQVALVGEASNTGNCSELSAIGYLYLERTGLRPIEYFGVYRSAWNHAFIILNRPEGSTLSDLKSWSSQAVVCDPLYDRADEAGMLAIWYPRMFPLVEKDLFVRVTG